VGRTEQDENRPSLSGQDLGRAAGLVYVMCGQGLDEQLAIVAPTPSNGSLR
jgi:hypothetical protein